jgi:glycosyltransferase involved in cell wall biosynthesis
MYKVSVIIPTFNRFKFLLNTLESVKTQTYKDIEIIVVNDGSIQKEYYEYDWINNGIIINHLNINTKSPAFVRNLGVSISTGKYIAFCDDDDIWFPNKIELQIKAMIDTGCKMSSTEGIIGKGMYNKCEKYPKYNSEYFYNTLKNIYKQKGSNLLDNGFPNIWNLEFLKIHNCIITSSLIIDKDILLKINGFKHILGSEDYDCWLRSLVYTNNVYIDEVCFYYDNNHGMD